MPLTCRRAAIGVYHGVMHILANPEWHWWIAVVLTPLTILAVLAVPVGYIVKVVAPRYPKKGQKRQE